MPQENQLAHRNVRDTNLPYISNQSPTVTEPCFVKGSTDILTSINGYCSRRPGFADAVEPTPTVFHDLQRLFTWDDSNNNFYVMACDINASQQAQVYKMQLGLDSSFVSIYTDTGSTIPFDFVVSNNIVYFGNLHVMKKWNPTIGVENWGISIGSINNATSPTIAGNGADGGGAHPWSNPNNVTSAVSYATGTYPSGGSTNQLAATQFGFSIPAINVITGIEITFTAYISAGGGTNNGVTVYLLKNGNVTGIAKRQSLVGIGSPTTFTLGATSDLWGGAFTATDIDQTTWGVAFYGSSTLGNGTVSLNNVKATIFSLGGPVVTLVSGTLSATVGYEYVFTYGNSMTGHMSSPTPNSASTGAFSTMGVQVALVASTDPQVNQIHVFRTTDSVPAGVNGGTFFELPTSPYPNTTANITDNAPDTSLNIFSIAPTPGFNDPPPPSMGFVYFSGRIWMCTGNKVWFTGLEEINNGVPEESVPSGVAGNFWSFDQQAQGNGVAGTGNNQVMVTFCGGRVYGITGNSLDTFRRFLVSNRRGCRSRTTIAMLGGMCAWLDSSGQVWATDGSSLEELSIPIRPDLIGVNQFSASMTFHTVGNFHWLVLSTGDFLYVYDVDTEQWMPPWSYEARLLFSGEISAGNYVLMSSLGTEAVQLNASKFNDLGKGTYAPVIRTNLFSVVPDFGRRFSYIAAGIYDEPSRTGQPWYIEVDTNATTLADVAILADDDPTTSSYTSITSNKTTAAVAWNRNSGVNIQQNVYSMTQPVSRWIGWQITLANADQVDNVYGWFLAYKSFGGK